MYPSVIAAFKHYRDQSVNGRFCESWEATNTAMALLAERSSLTPELDSGTRNFYLDQDFTRNNMPRYASLICEPGGAVKVMNPTS